MKKITRNILETLVVILGNCLYAFGVAMFIVPGGLITGGSTGIGLFVHQLSGIPVSVFVLVFNSLMFLAGFLVFGWKFAANTIVSTFSYPIALELITRLLNGRYITQDLMLCTIFWRNLHRRRNRNCYPDGSCQPAEWIPAAGVKPFFQNSGVIFHLCV